MSRYDHKIETSLEGIEHLSKEKKEEKERKMKEKNHYYNPLNRNYYLKSIMFCPLSPFLFRDLSFGIRKLHHFHFVFLLIVLGYQSLFLFSSFSFSLDLISGLVVASPN